MLAPGLARLTCKGPQQLPLAASGLLPLAAEPVARIVQAAACQAEHQDRPADTGARAHHRLKRSRRPAAATGVGLRLSRPLQYRLASPGRWHLTQRPGQLEFTGSRDST